MQKVYDFLRACNLYYLATLDGEQPRVRPFNTVGMFEGKLYIQTGKSKPVSKQMKANPHIEICAYDGKQWLRLAATVVEDPTKEVQQQILDAYPELKAMYAAGDENIQVFYLKDATATFSSFAAAPKAVQF